MQSALVAAACTPIRFFQQALLCHVLIASTWEVLKCSGRFLRLGACPNSGPRLTVSSSDFANVAACTIMLKFDKRK